MVKSWRRVLMSKKEALKQIEQISKIFEKYIDAEEKLIKKAKALK